MADPTFVNIGYNLVPKDFADAADRYLDSLAAIWRSGGWVCQMFDEDRDGLRELVLYDVAWRELEPVYQEWTSGSDPSLYTEEEEKVWKERFSSFEHFDWFLANLPAFLPLIERFESNKTASYTALAQQSFVLGLLKHLYEIEHPPQTAGKPDEEEPGAEEEEPAEEEEDDDGGGAQARQAQAMVKTIGEQFSYLPEIKIFATLVVERSFLRHVARAMVASKRKALDLWTRVIGMLRKVAEALGLGGIFIALDALMRRYKMINRSTRVLGTVVFFVGFLGLSIALPVWKIYNSPQRVLKLLGGVIKVELPGQPDE